MKSIEFILEQPLDYWKEHLKDHKLTKVILFLEVINTYFSFTKTSSELKPETEHRLLQEFEQLNYKTFLSSFYGILIDYDIEKLKLYQQIPSLTDERIKIIKDIQSEPDMLKVSSPYKESREQLLNIFEKIRL